MKKFWNYIKPYTTKAKWGFIGGGLSIGLIVFQDPEFLALVGEVPDVGPLPTNTLIRWVLPLATMWAVREKAEADQKSGFNPSGL